MDKQNSSTTETQTEVKKSDDEKNGPLAKFFEKHAINSNLVMLKVTLFVMHGGEKMKKLSKKFEN